MVHAGKDTVIYLRDLKKCSNKYAVTGLKRKRDIIKAY